MFKRPICQVLLKRLREPRRFIQVLAGPRQTGKTTLVRQVLEDLRRPSHYASADEPTLRDRVWIQQQWEAARRLVGAAARKPSAVLVLDEIQKAPNWSETVKFLWDQDSARRLPLHVVVLGSAPLLVQGGLSESLAGRFEVIPVTHWSLGEMQQAFGWDLDQYVYYGGYPGAAALIGQPERWRRYILDSLVETTIAKDILLMRRVDKPVLLRRLFEVGCHYSGQVLSFTKILGQLQEPGNTTTLAHYLGLLRACGLVEGLQKYAGQHARRRASSPKFQVHNNALLSSQAQSDFEQARREGDYWGRLVESAVGAHLVNSARTCPVSVYYWLDRDREVDFVLAKGRTLVALEVKSTGRRARPPGLDAFAAEFDVHRQLLIGGQGIPVAEFLTTPVEAWF
jgi:predicted AAA+ superfamily ATPase